MTDAELRQLGEWIGQLRWKSVEKDNMEYEVRMTCYVRDALMKFANEQKASDDHPPTCKCETCRAWGA